MKDKNIKQEIALLVKEINRLRKKYHQKDTNEISDEALDSLKHKLKKIEEKYPNLVLKESPTHNVEGGVKKGFSKVIHRVKQWSLDDIFSDNELYLFSDRIQKFIKNPKTKIIFLCEYKIDGVKVIVEYKNGKLWRASTRGDGSVGENITKNIETIKDIPKIIKEKKDLIVEGEVWISKKAFTKINKIQSKNKEKQYANPRNLAAGSLRQLDSSITAKRELNTFFYEVYIIKNKFKTQSEKISYLKKTGFNVNPNHKICSTIPEVISFYKKMDKQKNDQSYWVDGVVIKINDVKLQEKLGFTGKAPRFAAAYKFQAQQKTTKIKDIVFQIGRTGVVTPVAELDPITIAGSVVSRATLHNQDYINKLDVRIDDTVIIQKAGDIIPEIVSVLKKLRSNKTKKFIFPKKIKECGGAGNIERIPGESVYRCVVQDSFVQNLKKFAHFTSKKAFNIDGLGEKKLLLLIKNKVIKEYADIFKLKPALIMGFDRLGKKSANNLINSIKEKKTISLDRLLVALSINHIGSLNALLISKKFRTLEEIRVANKEDFEYVDGLGPIAALSLYNFFKDKKNKKTLEELLKHINITNKINKKIKHKWENKKIVITGNFTDFTRDELIEAILKVSGSVSNQVSGGTDILLCGKKPGTKFTKAESAGILILDMNETTKEIQKINSMLK